MNDQLRHFENKLAFEIDSWDLKVALDSGDAIVVVDARSNEAFNTRHIPGAVNIPHGQMSVKTTAEISPDSRIVTYCDGIGCNASTKGAINMARLGFCVRELIGGLDWWIRDGHPTHDTPASVSSGNCGCG